MRAGGLWLGWTLCASCLVAPGCGRSPAVYALLMANRTHQEFEAASVYFGKREAAGFGSLPPGGVHGYEHLILPIPPEAEVYWTDRGARKSRTVKLRGVVPDYPNDMNIYFIVENDGSVTVTAVEYRDVEANVKALKGIQELRRK